MKIDLIKEALTNYWGEPCPDYDKDCICCKAWKQLKNLEKRTQKGKA